MDSYQLANHLARLIWEKKGADILIMDLRPITSITDFFIICSVDTDHHARAIVDYLNDQLQALAVKPWHIEGSTAANWVLLDYVDVVVHLFRPETRSFYNLERLWGDAKMTEINDETFKDDKKSGT